MSDTMPPAEFAAYAGARIADLQSQLAAVEQERDALKNQCAEWKTSNEKLAAFVSRHTDEFQAQLQALQVENNTLRLAQQRRSESIHLEWSDRGGEYHPDEFADAVRSCSLDHYYDRTSDGIPDGMPERFVEVFRPIVAEHLSRVDPDWQHHTIDMTDEQRTSFENALNDALRSLLQELRDAVERKEQP